MKKIKKIVTLLLVICISMNLNLNVYATSDDTEGPVIESLTVDKTEATNGDIITYTLVATDASGIDNSFVALKLHCGSVYKYVYFNKQEDGTYKGTLLVSSDFINGKYVTDWLAILDTKGNEGSTDDFSLHYPNIGFNITGCCDDTEGPVIESLTVDKTEATNGDTITYTLVATDASGIDNSFVALKLHCGSVYKYVYFNKQEDGTYKGTLLVSSDFINGKYVTDGLSILDTKGNEGSNDNFSLNYPNIGFNVTGCCDDTEGPVIESLTVDKTEATGGDTITYTLQVTDASGIDNSFVALKLHCGSVYKYVYFNKQEDGTYKGTLLVSSDFINGKYVTDWLAIIDTKGNEGSTDNFSSHYPNIGFTIYSELDAPIIVQNSLAVALPQATIGQTERLYFKASDASGIKDGSVTYITPKSKEEKTYPCSYDVAKDQYYAEIPVVEYTQSGKWILKSITLNDNLISTAKIISSEVYTGENTVENSIDLSLGDFEVINTIEDTVAPVIETNSITMISNQINLNGSFVFQLKATDDLSGIESVKVNYLNPDGQVYTCNMNLKEDNIYEGKITVEDSQLLGKWNIQSICISDVCGNKQEYTSLLGKLNFTVIDESGNLNAVPVITAENIIYTKNQEYDLLDGINAYDKEDGSMNNKITIISNNLDITKSGIYSITYGVTDSGNASVQKTVKILVAKSGDVTFDNEIDIYDILTIQRYILGMSELTEKSMIVADVTGNSKVDVFDILAIQRHILGVEVIG